MSEAIIDSVMGHMKALLQDLTDAAVAADKQWREASKELQDRHSGWNQFEPTDAEERARKDEQRRCDELYDRSRIILECRSVVIKHVTEIIGENIEIQFSKWNMK